MCARSRRNEKKGTPSSFAWMIVGDGIFSCVRACALCADVFRAIASLKMEKSLPPARGWRIKGSLSSFFSALTDVLRSFPFVSGYSTFVPNGLSFGDGKFVQILRPIEYKTTSPVYMSYNAATKYHLSLSQYHSIAKPHINSRNFKSNEYHWTARKQGQCEPRVAKIFGPVQSAGKVHCTRVCNAPASLISTT